jgi:tRNA pseudouridine38-40 synthase
VLRFRINGELHHDIHVLSVRQAHPRFHARHDAVGRSYLYQVSRRRTAFGKRLVWWVREELDLNRMREAAALFIGMKNCESFAAGKPEETSTSVLIERVQIREAGALILIRIEGSHFLWKMVRRIVGVLVEAGRGRISIDDVARYLKSRSAEPARLAAPSSGLFLERVYYKGDSRAGEPEPILNLAG